jgi:methanogenic corrinoid protein MtbC1
VVKIEYTKSITRRLISVVSHKYIKKSHIKSIQKEAEAMGADIIGASSLMTTTMPGQKEIIELLKDKDVRDRYKVVIGGAPTGPEWADTIGADLWCENASTAPRLMAELLNK